jgi:hypothetical protein
MQDKPFTSDELRATLAGAKGPLLACTRDHAFVITGSVGDRVCIEDPADPNRKEISIDELNRILEIGNPDALLAFRPYSTR